MWLGEEDDDRNFIRRNTGEERRTRRLPRDAERLSSSSRESNKVKDRGGGDDGEVETRSDVFQREDEQPAKGVKVKPKAESHRGS